MMTHQEEDEEKEEVTGGAAPSLPSVVADPSTASAVTPASLMFKDQTSGDDDHENRTGRVDDDKTRTRRRTWSWSAASGTAASSSDSTTPSMPTTMSSITGAALSTITTSTITASTSARGEDRSGLFPVANATRVDDVDVTNPQQVACSATLLLYDPERLQWEREQLDLRQRNLDLERRQLELERQQQQQQQQATAEQTQANQKKKKQCWMIGTGLVVAALLVALGVMVGLWCSSSSSCFRGSGATTTTATTPPPSSTNKTSSTTAPSFPLPRTDAIVSYVNSITLSGQSLSYRRDTWAANVTAEERAVQWLVNEDVYYTTMTTNTTNVHDERSLRQRFALTTLWFDNPALPRSADHVQSWVVPTASECDWLNVTCVNGEVTKIELKVKWGNLQAVDAATGVVGKGRIPADLGLLTALTYLNMGETLRATTQQRASSSLATGGTTIPPSLGALTRLESLYLLINELTGTIPSTLGSLTALTALELSTNQLSGVIPSSLGALTKLSFLNLAENRLTGTIPSLLGFLTKLSRLHLWENRLNGTVPSELGSLTGLYYISLRSNQLTGTLPSSLVSWSNLYGFGLYNNNITGIMPFCEATTGSNNKNSIGPKILGADCSEIECECCIDCCPASGWKGKPGNSVCDE
jgi:flagellar basal body-associated protein FliL